MLPFLLILIGIILILTSLRLINGEDNHEKSFHKILEREELNNNKDYDLEIISIRKDLAETVMDLQEEIEELRNYIKTIKNVEKIVDNKNDNNKNNNEIKNDVENTYLNFKEDVISEINFLKVKDDKIENVKKLLDKGLSEEEICTELSIGRGEVLLIKGLVKK